MAIIAANKALPPTEFIFSLNQNREPESFVNPYLGFRMVDCRDLSDQFDVVFMPSHLGIEVDYLAYAPRRSNKALGGYRYGEKYGDDWYVEPSGSQWDRALFNCVRRNKAPNN